MTETVEPEAEILLEAEALSLSVPGCELLRQAALKIYQGDCLLLVGPSGAGKSVLLKVLTGLIRQGEEPYKIQGSMRLAGQQILTSESSAALTGAFRKTGLVFQNHALFDEMTVARNLEFARAHAQNPERAKLATEQARQFLTASGIGLERGISNLSGGQKQRVAIARTACADPEIVVYDEPTSALDPQSSRVVAELIASATKAFGKTAIIVSHDYEPFAGLVNRVIFLNPQTKTLEEIVFERLAEVMAEAKVQGGLETALESPSLLARLLGSTAGFCEGTSNALMALLQFLFYLLPWRARRRWFVNYCQHYARLIFWGSAVPYLMIAGMIVGFVATYFLFTKLPQAQHIEDEILPVLGAALFRVVIPVLTTLLVAGRTGAALASDLGQRILGQQVAAMKVLGAPEKPYLLTSLTWMNIVGTVLLNVVGFVTASVTSLVVFTLIQERHTPFYWASFYFNKIVPKPGEWLPPKTEFVLGKLIAASLVTAFVSYQIGTSQKRSGADVSFATTTTVYWATVGVLLVHFIFAFYEFDLPPNL